MNLVSKKIISVRIFLLLVFCLSWSVGILQADELTGDHARAEAAVLVSKTQDLESKILDGIRWSWIVERGRSKVSEKSLSAFPEFDSEQPIDRYQCQRLTNHQTMLLKQTAQQPQRILSTDKNLRIISATSRPYHYLQTAKSCLVLNAPQPAQADGRMMPTISYGRVGTVELNNTSSLQPTMLPLHSGSFALRHLRVLQERIEDPENKIVITNAKTNLGAQARLIKISKLNGMSMDYYFDPETSLLVQDDTFYEGKIISKSIVLKTHEIRNAESSITIPAKVIAWFGRQNGSWHISDYTISSAKLEAVPLQEMKIDIPIQNPKFAVAPPARLLHVRMPGVREITGAGLDDFVKEVIAVAKQTTRETYQRQEARRRKR